MPFKRVLLSSGISEFTSNIVRIGGRCDSEELDRFTLRSRRRKQRDRDEGEWINERNRRGLIWSRLQTKRRIEGTVESIEQNLARFEGCVISSFSICSTVSENDCSI